MVRDASTFQVSIGGKCKPSFLENVWYVPEISVNLFSLIVTEMKGYTVRAENSELQLVKNGTVCAVGFRRGKSLYKMSICAVRPDVPATVLLASAAPPKSESLQVWHERLCHQDRKYVQQFLQREGVSVTPDSRFCEACAYGKSHHQSFYSRAVRATKTGEIIHADLCGPMEEPSLRGMQYFVCFKDDYSKYRRVYIVNLKSEVPEKLREFLCEIAAIGHQVKVFVSDNGTEFDNSEVKKVLNGVEHQFFYALHSRTEWLCRA